MIRHLRFYWISGLVLAAILWLTLAPHPVGDVHVPLFPGADKLVHALMMATLTAALIWDVRKHRRGKMPGWPLILLIAIGVALFSWFDEWAQGAMRLGRTYDPLDLVADLTGIAVASVTALLIKAFQPQKTDKTR